MHFMFKTVISFGRDFVICKYLAHAQEYHDDVNKWKHVRVTGPFFGEFNDQLIMFVDKHPK